jgi:hypothetical protein
VDVAGSGSCPVAAFDTAVLNCRFAAIVLVTLSWAFSSRYCDLATGQTARGQGYVPTAAVQRDAPSLLSPGQEDDHSSPSSAEVKYAWSNASISVYAFMAWCMINIREIFTFT